MEGGDGDSWNDSTEEGSQTDTISGITVTEDRIGRWYRCVITEPPKSSGVNATVITTNHVMIRSPFDTWEYTYNADGLRVGKTNTEITYQYYYNGDKLSRMNVNYADPDVEDQELHFGYDASGVPQYVDYNGTRYFYLTNLQGDVTGIVSAKGTPVVDYSYDAWDKNLGVEGVRADNLGKLNPLRYRGYVYDEETGLYYVSSRYYDPEIGRFINADDIDYLGAGTSLTSYNLFAYCGNNPVSNVDPSGNAFFTALGSLTGFIAGALTATIHNALSDEKIDVFTAGTQGAIGGAISGAGVDVALLLIGSLDTALPVVALAGGIAYMAGGLGNAYTTYAASNGTASDEEMTMSFHIGGAFNLVSLGTSWGCVASNVDELMYLGNAGFKANLTVGTGIAVSTGIATGIGSKIFSACLN